MLYSPFVNPRRSRIMRNNNGSCMLKTLHNVKSGIENPSVLRNVVLAHRTTKIDVDFSKRILHQDDTLAAGIQHLQGDNCEGSLLLSSRIDGAILLHKIKKTTPSKYQCERLWKCSKNHQSAHRYSVECVRWFPLDNGIFVSAGVDKRLKIWDTSRLQCVETLTFEGKIYNFDLSPARTRNCTVAACTSKGIVTIFELQSGTNVHTLKHHIGDVLSCNWSPLEEHILCTGGADNRVLLWDIRSSKSFLMSLNRCNTIETTIENACINNFTAHTGSVNSVKFVKNGLKILSCGTDNIIRLWNSMTGKNELVNYDEFTTNSKRSLHIDITQNMTPEFAFVPSGSTINVYNVDSGEIVNRLRAHYNYVNCCYYEPYQHEFYSGCTDGFIFVWSYDEKQNDLRRDNIRRRVPTF